MSLLPGAEYAPILTRTIIDLGPEGSDVPLGRAICWRADVTDLDDMRAIWRVAAIALGESKVRAKSAVMVRDHRGLHLVIAKANGRTWLWTAPSDKAWSMEYSTAALCAHVWGPKPPAHQATP